MIQFTDNFSDKVTQPLHYVRQFENDLPNLETVKRVAMIALPILSLHQPFGRAISTGMGICRSATELSRTLKALSEGRYSDSLNHLTLTAFAVLALAGNYYQYKIGLVATTTVDLCTNLVRAYKALTQGNYDKAIDELLQAASSSLYLAVLLNGGLEYQLASTVLQGLLSLLQARKDWAGGRVPECLTKIVLGCAHMYQGYKYLEEIRVRDGVQILDPIQVLLERIQKGKEQDFLKNSPLNGEMHHVVLTDANDNSYDFGSHAHGYGGEVVKGMNLQFRARVIDGKNMSELEFKLQHVAREKLQTLVQDLNKLTPVELKQVIDLSESKIKGIRIENTLLNLSSDPEALAFGGATKITLEGLGSITIGNSKLYPNLYGRVRVQTEGEKNLSAAHELLSFFNLERVLQASTQDEVEKLKLSTLFHIFSPVQAISMERAESCANLTAQQLRRQMVKEVPEMENTFNKYLDKMQQAAILPGKMRYTIPPLVQEAKDLGARSLITTLNRDLQVSLSRLGSVLKMGILSSETRFSNGLNVGGISSKEDFLNGGADSVYMQLLTQKTVDNKMSLDLLYPGKVRILISPDILKTGTYQYPVDTHGSRVLTNYLSSDPSLYTTRPPLHTFVKDQQAGFGCRNEVMAKERVGPEYIMGVVVPNTRTRDTVMDYLREHDLVVKTADNKELILGKPAENFVKVSKIVTEELFV